MFEPQDRHIQKTGPKEIGWFIVLWILGVAGAGALAWAIRLILGGW